MTVKGCLLLITAIVKRFQAENIQVHPSDRLPFPFELCNHMWYYETTVVKLQGWEKSLMISLSVLIIYRRVTDRRTDTLW